MKEYYLETLSMIERLHRLFLEVIKCELDNLKISDINNVQALILYNLGGRQISIRELTVRGCYLGSNVSYNLKKMVDNDYVEQVMSKHDKRSCIIKASNKGALLNKKIDVVLSTHVEFLEKFNIEDIKELVSELKKFEKFWETAVQKCHFKNYD